MGADRSAKTTYRAATPADHQPRFASRLRVGQPDNPAERRADRFADAATFRSTGYGTDRYGAGRHPTDRHPADPGFAAARHHTDALPPRQQARIARDLSHLLNGGQPLAEGERRGYESQLPADARDTLDGIHLHRGPLAHRLAGELGAEAFTLGSHVVLGPEVDGLGAGARHTVAHEVGHALQGGAPGVIQRAPKKRTRGDGSDLPTGEKKDPIPIMWFKAKKSFPRIKEGGTVHKIGDSVDINASNTLDVEDENISPTLQDQPVKRIGGRTDNVKNAVAKALKTEVLAGNLQVLSRRASVDPAGVSVDIANTGGNKADAKALFPKKIFENRLFEIDHVRDLSWGGADEDKNLWPIDRVLNEGANANNNQWVQYQNSAGTGFEGTTGSLIGMWFQVFDFANQTPTTAGGHGTSAGNPINDGSGRVPINSDPRTADLPTGAKNDPIPIKWFKAKNSFPKIIDANGQTKEIGEEPKIGRQKQPKVPKKQFEPQLKTQKVVMLKQFSGASSRTKQENFRDRLLRAVAGRGVRIVSNRTAAQLAAPTSGFSVDVTTAGRQQDLFGETAVQERNFQVDHVFDLNWGGDDARDNLWPLDTRLNQGANAVNQQIVQYQDEDGDRETARVADLPAKTYFQIDAIADATPESSGGHDTDSDNPINDDGDVSIRTI